VGANNFTKKNAGNGLPGQNLLDAGLNVFGLQLFLESYTDHKEPPPLTFRYLGVDVSVSVPGSVMDGVRRIHKERIRQTEKENWDAEHDAEHASGELLLLAACYLLKNYTATDNLKDAHEWVLSELFAYWGHDDWVKYGGIIRDLEKAGALIAAEIDRLLAAGEEGG